MKKIFTILMLFVLNIVFSQGEGNIWYFGNNAGLDFNSGVPAVLTDGQLNTVEGCATISDAAGQLLFYTDGVKVYNKNHQIMPNGSNLLGNFSSSQSAIIVPKPQSTTIYYVFTCTDIAKPDGVRYSEVDLSLNGGLGDVTSIKNMMMFSPACEKLAAVKNTNGDGYWLVGHEYGNNNFRSYSISSTGINMTPVISSAGSSISANIYKTLGYLKFSIDGTQLISCNKNLNVELFDFNLSTGVVSNPKLVTSKIGSYGVEFSPSGNLAYITTGTTSTASLELFQFDLTASNIPNSALMLYEMGFEDLDYTFGALQLATDGKIYVTRNNLPSLSVIQNPDVVGSGCGFQLNALSLGSKIAQGGLPQFIQSYFNVGIAFENNCLGEPTFFSLTANQNITSAVWNFGDGTTSTNVNAIHTYLAPGNYTVTLNAVGTNGTISKSRAITIYASPIAFPVPNKNICGTEGMSYNLAQHTNTVRGSQSSSVFGVSYFLTIDNATTSTNALPENFVLSLGTTTVYAKIYNSANTNCYSITSFAIDFFEQPIANQLVDYVICENQPYDFKEQFDLQSKNIELLGMQSASDFTITYHDSQEDADAGIDALPFLYTNTNPIEIVFARIENNFNATCFDTVTFQLKVVQQPIINPVSVFRMCDDAMNDGTALFDLSQKTNEILNGQSTSVFEVHYFLLYSEAEAHINVIASPIVNISADQVVYYSITAIGNANCKTIGSFNLKVDQMPLAYTANLISVCDDNTNDGKAIFNLQENYSSIIGNQSVSDVNVSYYESLDSATSKESPLPFSYENSSNPQTIYVRVENNANAQCYAITSYQIKVNKLPKANPIPFMLICDEQNNDGMETFDLTVNNSTILDGQSSSQFSISYHTTEANAQGNSFPLPDNFINTSNPQTIFARITNNENVSCYDITSFDLEVRDKPLLNMLDSYSICEGLSKKLTADSGYDTYEWSTGETTETITVATAGNYWVKVTKDYGDLICETIEVITVVNSNKATIINIETSDWTSDQNGLLVLVVGDGNYEYSLDGENYQNSPQFIGLTNGIYTVYVRDKNECGITKEEIYLLMYPKFFTPNSDGFNDTWHIKFSSYEPELTLKIFDRYGKFIVALSGSSEGWDGTYNGVPLPSSDYWFVAKRKDGKEFKGHFSLKR